MLAHSDAIMAERLLRIETIASIDGISAEDASGIFNILKAGSKNPQYDANGAREAYRYGYYGLVKFKRI